MKYVIKPTSKAPVPKKDTVTQKGAEPQRKQVPIKKESFISKCIGVIIDDINWKIRGIKSAERIEMEKKQEIYESFYRMTKGGK